MRVLYVVGTGRMTDGSSKSFLNMVEGVRNGGHDVGVILPDYGLMVDYLNSIGIQNWVIPFEFDTKPVLNTGRDVFLYVPRNIKRVLKNRMARKPFFEIASKFMPDFIHSNVSTVSLGFITAKRLGIPHVYHLREYGDLDFNLRIRNIERYLKKSYTICITKDIARHRNLLGNVNNRVIYNGIYSADSLRMNPNKEPYFLYAGAITERKGFKMLLEAYMSYAGMVKHPFELRICGKTPEREAEKMVIQLKGKLDNLGIGDKVKWLGMVDSKRVADEMYNASAVIVPSYNEGFGRVAAEAMFNGALVIGYDAGGIKEQLDNGLNLTGAEIGLRFNSSDQLTSLLENITINTIEGEPLIKRAQETVKALYSNESYVDNILQFYSSLNLGGSSDLKTN